MEIEQIRHFFERIAQYANDANKEVKSGAVPFHYIAQIGLTVNSALKYVDQLPNKHTLPGTLDPIEQRKANAILRDEIDALPTQNPVKTPNCKKCFEEFGTHGCYCVNRNLNDI